MPLILPNIGLPTLLDILLRKSVGGLAPWELFVWSNDLIPDANTVYDSLVLATFTGYSPITLVRNNWLAAFLDGDKAVSTYTSDAQTWVCTAGPQTVYGYGVRDFGDSTLYICERFSTPQDVLVGGTLGVLPRFTLRTDPD